MNTNLLFLGAGKNGAQVHDDEADAAWVRAKSYCSMIKRCILLMGTLSRSRVSTWSSFRGGFEDQVHDDKAKAVWVRTLRYLTAMKGYDALAKAL